MKQDVGGGLVGMKGTLHALHKVKVSGTSVTIFVGLYTVLYTIYSIILVLILDTLDFESPCIKIIVLIAALLVPLVALTLWIMVGKLGFIRFVQRLGRIFTYSREYFSD